MDEFIMHKFDTLLSKLDPFNLITE